jgi:hypothetical protein
MGLTTSFNLLISAGINQNILTDVEGMTGNRNLYGLDKPIRIIDILNASGIETALSCFICNEDTRDIEKAIAIEWILANLLPWNAYTGSDAEVLSLVTLCAQYQSAKLLTPGEVRYDYCGVPLDLNLNVAIEQVHTSAVHLQARIDAFPVIKTPENYHRVIFGIRTMPSTFNNGTKIAGPLWDYVPHPNIPSFSQEQTIIDDLVAQGTLLQQSADWYDTYLNNPPIVNSASYNYLASYSPPFGSGGFHPDYYAEGAYRVAQAAITLATMIIYDTGVISSVSAALVAAIASYREGESERLHRDVTRLKHLQYSTCFPITCFAGGCDVIDRQIRTAEEEIRRDLLTDLSYVLSFDQSGNRFLSTQERTTMEIDVKAQMLAARQAKAQELYTASQAELTTVLTLTSVREAIFSAHLV